LLLVSRTSLAASVASEAENFLIVRSARLSSYRLQVRARTSTTSPARRTQNIVERYLVGRSGSPISHREWLVAYSFWSKGHQRPLPENVALSHRGGLESMSRPPRQHPSEIPLSAGRTSFSGFTGMSLNIACCLSAGMTFYSFAAIFRRRAVVRRLRSLLRSSYNHGALGYGFRISPGRCPSMLPETILLGLHRRLDRLSA